MFQMEYWSHLSMKEKITMIRKMHDADNFNLLVISTTSKNDFNGVRVFFTYQETYHG